jgi:hypothetical protein
MKKQTIEKVLRKYLSAELAEKAANEIMNEKGLRTVQELTENEAIHCSTEQEARAICEFMHIAGLKWASEDSYSILIEWDKYKENTCYIPKRNSFAYVDFCKREGYNIYPASDFLPSTFYTTEK